MRYTKLRARRMSRLAEAGYSTHEALLLTRLPLKQGGHLSVVLNRPYVKRMMRERKRQADAGMPIERLKTTQQAWREFRFWYDESLILGDYFPPKSKRQVDSVVPLVPLRVIMSKGNVKAQRVRARERRLANPEEMERYRRQRAAQRQRAKERQSFY